MLDLPEKASYLVLVVPIKRVNRLWRKEKQMVSYTEYEMFAKQFMKKILMDTQEAVCP